MFSRITIRFGAALLAVAALDALLLATLGGSPPIQVVLPAVTGATLVAVGIVARNPFRASLMWLVAVTFAAILMLGSIRGFMATVGVLGGGTAPTWWQSLDALLLLAGGAYIVAIATVNVIEGRRQVEEARLRRDSGRQERRPAPRPRNRRR